MVASWRAALSSRRLAMTLSEFFFDLVMPFVCGFGIGALGGAIFCFLIGEL